MSFSRICSVVFLIFFLSCFQSARSEESVPDPVALMQECVKSYASIQDYTAIFLKQQRVRDRLRKQETILMKFRKPFSIYMKWIEHPDKGKEVIFEEGKNEGKLVAHLGGFLKLVTPTLKLDPESSLAMGGNLRPITKAGLGNTIESLWRVFQEAKEKGDLAAVTKGIKNFNGQSVAVVERYLPMEKGYPNAKAIIYIDLQLKLPVYYAAYDQDDNLLEEYVYEKLKTNVGLTDKDFDKSNYNYSLF